MVYLPHTFTIEKSLSGLTATLHWASFSQMQRNCKAYDAWQYGDPTKTAWGFWAEGKHEGLPTSRFMMMVMTVMMVMVTVRVMVIVIVRVMIINRIDIVFIIMMMCWMMWCYFSETLRRVPNTFGWSGRHVTNILKGFSKGPNIIGTKPILKLGEFCFLSMVWWWVLVAECFLGKPLWKKDFCYISLRPTFWLKQHLPMNYWVDSSNPIHESKNPHHRIGMGSFFLSKTEAFNRSIFEGSMRHFSGGRHHHLMG